MYAHFPQAVAGRADGEGIVKVLGVVRVDGEGEHVAEVLAACDFFGRDARLELFGGILHSLGIVVGQSEFGQDGVHFGIVLSLPAQDVDHLSDGALRLFGPFHDFHHGLVARLSALELVLGDEDVGGQRAAFGDEEAVALFHLQETDEGVLGAADDFDDFGFAGVSRPAGHHGDAHAVAVEGVA